MPLEMLDNLMIDVSSYLNVKDYGAKGDGSSHPLSSYYGTLAEAQTVYPAATALTDELDWAAIQSLLDKCKLSGGTTPCRTVYVSKGTYVVNKPLRMWGWGNLIGEGENTAIIKNTGVGTPCLRITGDRVSVRDIQIKGNATGNYGVNGTTGDGIILDGSYYDGCGYVTLDHVQCVLNGGNGIRVYAGNWIHNFRNCTCSQNTLNGICIDWTDGTENSGQKNMIDISVCTVAGNGLHGMLIFALNINICGCTIENNKYKGISMDCHDLVAWDSGNSVLTSSANNTAVNIIGNYFEGGFYGSIVMRGGRYGSNPYTYGSFDDITIMGNYIYGTSLNAASLHSIIYGQMENFGTMSLMCKKNSIPFAYGAGTYVANFNDCLSKTSEIEIDSYTFKEFWIGLTNAVVNKDMRYLVDMPISYYDDFLQQTINESDTPWIFNKGSNSNALDPRTIGGAGGKLRLTTGTADGTTAADASQVVCAYPVQACWADLEIEIGLVLGSIDDISVCLGLTDTTALEEPFTISGTTITSNASNAVCMVYDSDATTKEWYACAVDSDVDEVGNASIGIAPIAGTLHRFKILVQYGEIIQFLKYVNGRGFVTVARFTTTGVSSVVNLYATVIACSTSAKASKNVDVDYIKVSCARNGG